MLAEQLRAAILQAAISGKLTEQRPDDGTAADLHRQIAEEEVYLTKAGRLKKHKPLPPIVEDERPFDIPKTWRWVHFGTVAEFNPKVVAREDTLVSFLPMACIEDGYSGVIAPESRTWGDVRTNYSRFANGDVIIAKITPCFQNRKSAVVHALENGIGAGTTELHVIRPLNGLSRRFVFWLVKSSYLIDSLVPLMTGTAGQKRVPLTALKNLPFPLPPLAEQERIVAKLDKLMPLIDQLAELEREREDLDRAFFTALEAAILQAATEGKLTRQRPEDGNAADLLSRIAEEKTTLVKAGKLKKPKPLPPVTEDEQPFEIPDNWEWARLGEVSNYGTVVHVDPYDIPAGAWILNLEDIEKDSGRLLSTSRDRSAASTKVQFCKGDVLYSKLRPYLNKVLIAPADGYATTEIMPMRIFTLGSNEFARYLLISPYFNNYVNSRTYGMKMPRLGTKDALQAPVSLPPLAEQERIVAKLDAVLPLVRELQEASA